jgi:hypothetical protein
MGRTLLAGTPRDPQPGGEAVEIGCGRRALGDLFLGPYPRDFVGQTPQIVACLRA